MWRRTAYVVGGLLLLGAALLSLEWFFPAKQTLPPIRPMLERVDDRTILVDAGMIDELRFSFGQEDSVQHVDGVYRCLEQRLEESFGAGSEPQGETRWSRRLEVGRRLRQIESDCL